MVLGSELQPSGSRVTYLNDLEMNEAYNYARDIGRQSATSVVDQAVTKDQSKIIDGFAGEIAFCKIHNCYLPKSSESRPWDVMIGGKTIDIKTTQIKRGLLLVKYATESNPADLYALIIGNGRRFEYMGYATKKQMFAKSSLGDLGYGPVWMLEQSDLNKELIK